MKNKHILIKRSLITVALLLLYYILARLPLPFVPQNDVETENIWSFVASINGASSGAITLFSLGMMPYFMSTLVIKILTSGISPTLAELSKGTAAQRKKFKSLSKLMFYVIALLQSFSYLVVSGVEKTLDGGLFSTAGVLTAMAILAGALLSKFLADTITSRGLANGFVLIISIMLIGQIFDGLAYIVDASNNWPGLVFNLGLLAFLVAISVYLQRLSIKLPVYVDSVAQAFGVTNSVEPLKDNLTVSVMCVGITPIVYYSLAATLLAYAGITQPVVNAMITVTLIYIFTEIAIRSDFDADGLFNTFMFNGIYFRNMKQSELDSKKALKDLFMWLAKINTAILVLFYSVDFVFEISE